MTRIDTLILIGVGAALPARADVEFRKHIIDPEFRAEACTAFDIDRDGRLDLIAGEYWYQPPQWTRHRFRHVAFEGGYAVVRLDHPADVNGDGWMDIVSVRRGSAMEWLENPKGQETLWPVHPIGESQKTEGIVFGDVNGDGRGDLVGPTDPWGAGVGWWDGASDGSSLWSRTVVGRAGGDAHGMGLGDVNHDGRTDILTRFGWYEAPADARSTNWPFHQADRGETDDPVVYDFDGDGDQDIAAAYPHGYGLYWWESSNDHGRSQWTPRLIDDSISQLHDLKSVDIDGDGDTDLLTGKRYHAHHGRDPGAEEPAMLVWYELQRDGRRARFIRHDIDDDSGIGYVVTPIDMDGDGDMDVLTSNQKGVFLFEQTGKPMLEPLFNGKDLANWIGDKTLWHVEGNTIASKTDGLKHNHFLVSRNTYANFVMTLDVKLVPDTANSGIQFRSTPRENGEVEGYQADIGQGWWGSIYEELGRQLLNDGYKNRGEKAVLANQWNRYVLYAVGDELRTEINGTVCTHLRDHERKNGVIALQIHSGGPTDIQFRNIRLKKVD